MVRSKFRNHFARAQLPPSLCVIEKTLGCNYCIMLEETVKDYVAYFKLDVANGFQSVQDVIDNMLTRLEELTSVLQMVKLKNVDCNTHVSNDINKYRSEITTLSRKVAVLNQVMVTMHNNVDLLERQVVKAEADFGINNENKLKSFFKPLLKRNKEPVGEVMIVAPEIAQISTVLDNFEDEILS